MNGNIYTGNPDLLDRDWFRERMRQKLGPIRGTKIAVTPQSNNAKICGRSLDESVMVGGFGGLPIVDGSVGVSALGGTAYAAPTWTGPVTITTSSTPLSVDVVTQATFNNVPQDGNCNAILWLFRRNGQSTWTPWAETPLSGLPTPPASQVQSFGYGNLTSGLAYDFGCCYVAANGAIGAIATLRSNYAVPAVGIPSSYMLGGTAITPTFSGVTNSIGTSANGISTPCTLNWTCTNQPTDGSLSRVSMWIRQNGTTNWTYYASLQAVGVNSSTPPASGAYSFTFTDLTNGLTYDFGLSYENAQGGESNVAVIVSGVQMPNVGPPPTAKMPGSLLTNGPSISSDTIGAWSNAGTATPSLPVGVTFSDWTTTVPAWLLGVRFYIRQHGTTAKTPMGDQTVPSGTNSISVQFQLTASTIIDIGCSYLDNAGQESAVAWPGGVWNDITVPAVGPTGVGMPGGPNLVPDSKFAYVNFNGSGIGSNDPYWNFYLIDGASFFIGKGGDAGGDNYLGVRPGDSGKTCKAQSEVINVNPNTQYTVSAYIDARTCGGASQPYISITSTDQATEYARAAQTIGQNGIVSATYTTPASGGPTQITVLFNSNNCTINSSILVFGLPMFQVGQLSGYTPGPAVGNGPPSGTGNNPPPSGGSGGGAGDPGDPGGGDGGGHHKYDTLPHQTRYLHGKNADANGSYFTSGQISAHHFYGGNSGDTGAMVDSSSKVLHTRHSPQVQGTVGSSADANGSYLATGVISGRHFHGGNASDTGAMVDSSSNLLYTRHHLAVRTSLNSSADTYGSYVAQGQIHGGVLYQPGSIGTHNYIFNPTFANGTAGWSTDSNGTWSTDSYGLGRLHLTQLNTTSNPICQQLLTGLAANSPMIAQCVIEIGQAALAGSNAVYLRVGDGTNQLGLSSGVTASSGTGRFFQSCTFTVPSNGQVYVQACLIGNGAGAVSTSDIIWSKFQVEYGSKPTQWVDHYSTLLVTHTHTATAGSDGSYFGSNQITDRHIVGLGGTGTAIGDGSGKIKFGYHATPVQGALTSAADTYGSYLKYGSVHRLHFDLTGQPGASNLLFNPTFANGTAGWTKTGSVFSWSTDSYSGGRLMATIPASTAANTSEWYGQTFSPPFVNQQWVVSGIIEVGNPQNSPSGQCYVDVHDSGYTKLLGAYTINFNNTGSNRYPFSFAFSDGGTAGPWIIRCVIGTGPSAQSAAGSTTAIFYRLQFENGVQPSMFVDHRSTALTTFTHSNTAGGEGSYLNSGMISARHFYGGNASDTGAMVDSSSNLLYARHHVAFRNAISSAGYATNCVRRTSSVNDLEGHNLLHGTAFYNTILPWTTFVAPGWTGTYSITPDHYCGGRVVMNRINTTGSGSASDLLLGQTVDVGAGGSVTVSGFVELEANGNFTLGGGVGAWVDLVDETTNTVLANSTPLSAVTGQTYFEFTANGVTGSHTIQVRLRTQFTTGTAYFYKIKCEYGTLATPWNDPIAGSCVAYTFAADGTVARSTAWNNQGSMPPCATPGVSITSSNSSGNCTVTISWTAGTIYTPDNGSIAIASGSWSQSSLSASTAYHYSVYADASGTVHILGNYGNNTAPTAQQKYQIYLDTRYPITEDTYVTTPATSGGAPTGGGGGGGGSCPSVDQVVETKEYGFVPARVYHDAVQRGEKVHLRGPKGQWVRVLSTALETSQMFLVRVRGQRKATEVDVNHRWQVADGEWVRVTDLNMNSLLRTIDGRLREVVSIRKGSIKQYVKTRVVGGAFIIDGAIGHNAITQ